VLATEVGKSSVEAAHYNLEANGLDHVTLVRMSSDEISAALAKVRPFKRLRDIDLDAYRFSTLFVDPPRSGLDARTLDLARGFDNILYISCNPLTLKENVAALQESHAVAAAAAFDQFPYTHHLECGLLLKRR
jgi:tRNA (uracil-5-)-methyltransferase